MAGTVSASSPAQPGVNLDDPQFYVNRELALLNFQWRVLEEAKDPTNPLLERARFLSIVGSNLDEFFMVRVASLKAQLDAGIPEFGPDRMSPSAQLVAIRREVKRLRDAAHQCLESARAGRRQRMRPPRRRRTHPGPARGCRGRRSAHRQRRGLTVSGTRNKHTPAAASTARYTSNTRTVGCGPNWAKSPAMSGPRPRPPMFTTVATSDARRLAEAGTSSVSAAVAVPVIRPADSPDRIQRQSALPRWEPG